MQLFLKVKCSSESSQEVQAENGLESACKDRLVEPQLGFP